MSRDYLPKRPSDYQNPRFMSWVPDEAEQEAREMASRHGVAEPRDPKAKRKAASSAASSDGTD